MVEELLASPHSRLNVPSTVPAGKAIEFKGMDLLTIDLPSKKVMNVTTSGDLLNYYRALGYPLGVESVTNS